jgi:hypothetical protein
MPYNKEGIPSSKQKRLWLSCISCIVVECLQVTCQKQINTFNGLLPQNGTTETVHLHQGSSAEQLLVPGQCATGSHPAMLPPDHTMQTQAQATAQQPASFSAFHRPGTCSIHKPNIWNMHDPLHPHAPCAFEQCGMTGCCLPQGLLSLPLSTATLLCNGVLGHLVQLYRSQGGQDSLIGTLTVDNQSSSCYQDP